MDARACQDATDTSADISGARTEDNAGASNKSADTDKRKALEQPETRDVPERSAPVTSQDVRLEIERKQLCALHSCIENMGNFRAFK
jgi:hypothetical protein